MVHTVMGLILSGRGLGLVVVGPENEIVRIVAEVTLILVLATVASRIDVRWLVKDHNLSLRLLAIGLPLMMLTFMLVFGVVMLPPAIDRFDGAMLLYAVLSLAAIRLVSVFISMLGSRLRPATVGFLVRFGPRGVAPY